MPSETNNLDPRFALDFLIEANLLCKNSREDVPEDFIDRHIKLIKSLNNKAILESKQASKPEADLKKVVHKDKITFKKKWTHKSVLQLVHESEGDDPIEEIRTRARKVVLNALEKGWSGPPFNSIELAKILNIDITPNDTIIDARTISKGKNKYLIEFNPFQKATRLNFSVAHEIAHTLFSDCHEAIRNREDDPYENRELEQLCNLGASEFQLPYVIFPHDANDLHEISSKNLVQLAQKYKASLESTFLGFVAAVNKPCAVLISTFQSEKNLVLDYFKPSTLFKPRIPYNFQLPEESKAYYCISPGWTESETVSWDFLDLTYDAHYVGISPIRRENKARVGIIIVPNDGNLKLQDRRINIEFGDATKPRGKGIKIIAQVVNTSGGLGFGFGKSLSKNYPVVKDALKKWKDDRSNFKLGQSQLIQVSRDTFVYQMLAQKGLFTKNDQIPLDYESLQICLASLREESQRLNADVFMPLIGSGQAKGKWEVIEGMIYTELVNQGIKVNIYLLNAQKAKDFNPSPSLSIFNEKSTWLKEK